MTKRDPKSKSGEHAAPAAKPAPTPTPAAAPAAAEVVTETAVVKVEGAQPPAVKDEAPLSVAEQEFGEFTGYGMATIAPSLIKIPRLILVQKGTPGVDREGDPLFGKVGCFYNPLTGRVYDRRGFVGVMLQQSETFEEITPQPEGKWVGTHHRTDAIVQDGMKYVAEKNAEAEREGKKDKPYSYGKVVRRDNGNWLVETHSCLSILAPVDDKGEPIWSETFGIVAPFRSTGIPDLSRWSTGIANNTRLADGREVGRGKVPMFGNHFRLSAVFGEKGKNTWYQMKIEPWKADYAQSITSKTPLFAGACDVAKGIQAGTHVIDNDAGRDMETAPNDEGGGKKIGPDGKEMEF